jgi:predicted ATPase
MGPRPVVDRAPESALLHVSSAGLGRSATQHNLGPPLTDFLGRSDDIEALVHLLGRTRLVTLVGPGGVGKTRLALEVAVHVTDRYADGVWMSELGPIEAGSDVVEGIASSLGVKQREAATTIDAVVEWLGPRAILIVLDNCEHVLNPVRTFVEQILRHCPAVTFLSVELCSKGPW